MFHFYSMRSYRMSIYLIISFVGISSAEDLTRLVSPYVHCENTNVTKTMQKSLIKNFNKLRSKVALGEIKQRSGYLPEATRMMKLQYSCELAKKGLGVDFCAKGDRQPIEMFLALPVTLWKKTKVAKQIKENFVWDTEKLKNLSGVNYDKEAERHSYVPEYLRDNLTEIGAHLVTCKGSNYTYLYMIFKGLALEQIVPYKSGPLLSECTEDDVYADQNTGLCSPWNTMPTTTTTTVPTTTLSTTPFLSTPSSTAASTTTKNSIPSEKPNSTTSPTTPSRKTKTSISPKKPKTTTSPTTPSTTTKTSISPKKPKTTTSPTTPSTTTKTSISPKKLKTTTSPTTPSTTIKTSISPKKPKTTTSPPTTSRVEFVPSITKSPSVTSASVDSIDDAQQSTSGQSHLSIVFLSAVSVVFLII